MPIARPEIPKDLWEKIHGQAGAVLKYCLDLLSGSKWENPSKDGEMDVWTASVEGSKVRALKAEMTIPYPIQSCLSSTSDGIEIDADSDPKIRKATLFRHQIFPDEAAEARAAKFVEYRDPAAFAGMEEPTYDLDSVLQFVVTSPSPAIVAHREFVVLRFVRDLPPHSEFNPGDHRRLVIVHQSWNGKALTEALGSPEALFPLSGKGEKWVRADMRAQAFIFEEIDAASCKGQFVVHTDPCGMVPSGIYNSILSGQARTLSGVQKWLDKSLKGAAVED